MPDAVTPYQAVFESTGIADQHFPLIQAAAAGSGETVPDRDRFLALPPVGELLSEITPAAGEGSAQIALLAFHAYRRWLQGGEDLVLTTAALTDALGVPVIGGWRLAPPAPAGYAILPRHLLWVPGEPAEPVDGFFWVAGDAADNALDLLLVLGMHDARSGFTVVELASGPLPADGHWGDLTARADGADFANVLPGGERLLGLSSTGEALKLVSRVFWQWQQHG